MLEQRRVIPIIWRLIFPLILGVVFSFYTKVYPSVTQITILLLTAIWYHFSPFNKLKKSKIFSVLAFAFFFFFGSFINGYHDYEEHDDYFNKSVVDNGDIVQLKVSSIPEEKEKSIKIYADVLKLNGHKAMGKTLLYFEKDSAAFDLSYGDELLISAAFQTIKSNGNPKAFDYSQYLKLQYIKSQAYVPSKQWRRVGNSGHFLFKKIVELRNYLERSLVNAGLSNSSLMIAKALILGNKTDLDSETLNAYSKAGAMHVLAVSGLHVGIVMLILSFVLRPLKQVQGGKFMFLLVVLIGVWLYALLSGFSASVLRSAIMFSFIIIGKELERETSVYQSIAVSAFLMIIIEPLVIFQVGFQLSYLAVLGIVYLQPKIYKLLYFKWFISDKVWQITTVSIAAQVATFPLGLYYFHQFPNYFLLSNLIVIPLAFVILFIAFLYFLTQWVPVLDDIVSYIFDLSLRFMNMGVAFVEQLPYSTYGGVWVNWYEVLLIYAMLILGVVAFFERRKSALLFALMIGWLMIILNINESNILKAEKLFVVYSTPKDVAIDVFHGRSNSFYVTPELSEDENALMFHVKQNWFYRTGRAEAFYKTILFDNSNLIPVGSDWIWVTKHVGDSIPDTKYVLLYELEFIPAELISIWKENETIIILGHSIPISLKRFLYSALEPEKIHDLKDDGAFQKAWD